MNKSFEHCFGAAPEITAEAPGRIEFIGNHTDYNGGLVMGVALDRRIRVEARRRDDRRVRLGSADRDGIIEVELDALSPLKGEAAWANYPLGVLYVLLERGTQIPSGMDLFVSSTLPTGAGLSSSAALELSSLLAVAGLFDIELSKAELARLGRRAENTFVGVPCGILDQGVSAFGEEGRLVRIDCATEAFSTVPLPEGTQFWIFNTRQQHSLVESLYATRHKECSDAMEVLRRCGSRAPNLASVEPEEIKNCLDLAENLRKRALHISQEHRRVQAMEAALARGDAEAVGQLLYASHESSRTLFENSTPQLDALVEILREREGVLGARLTGGGFGGAVMALTTDHFSPADAQEVVRSFSSKFDSEPLIFNASSGDGAQVVQR